MLSMTQQNTYHLDDPVFAASFFDSYQEDSSSNGEDTSSIEGEESYDRYEAISFNNVGEPVSIETISPNWINPSFDLAPGTDLDYINPQEPFEFGSQYQTPSYYLIDSQDTDILPQDSLYEQTSDYTHPLRSPLISMHTSTLDVNSYQTENVHTTNNKKRERENDTHTTAPRKKFKKPREKWSELEEDLFVSGIRLYGRDYRKVEAHVKTKTIWQIRSHAQKYFLKQKKKEEQKNAASIGTSNKELTPKEAPVKKEKLAGPSAASSAHLPSHNIPWTDQERKLFLEGLETCGKGQWKKISEYVGTRNALQVKNHARQYFKKLNEAAVSTKNVPATNAYTKKNVPTAPQTQYMPHTVAMTGVNTVNNATLNQNVNTPAYQNPNSFIKSGQPSTDDDEELEIDDDQPMPVVPSPILVQTELPVMHNGASNTVPVSTIEPRSRGVTIEHNLHVKVNSCDNSKLLFEPASLSSPPVPYQDPFSSDLTSPFNFADMSPEFYHYLV